MLLWSRHLFAHQRRDQGVLPGDEAHRSINSDVPSSEGQGRYVPGLAQEVNKSSIMGSLGSVWRPLIASWVADEHLVPKDRDKNTTWSKAAASPGVNRTQRTCWGGAVLWLRGANCPDSRLPDHTARSRTCPCLGFPGRVGIIKAPSS